MRQFCKNKDPYTCFQRHMAQHRHAALPPCCALKPLNRAFHCCGLPVYILITRIAANVRLCRTSLSKYTGLHSQQFGCSVTVLPSFLVPRGSLNSKRSYVCTCATSAWLSVSTRAWPARVQPWGVARLNTTRHIHSEGASLLLMSCS